MRTPCVYMLMSANHNALYIGVTSRLKQRVWQHKSQLVEGFSKKYKTHYLVYYEIHNDMPSAITREKQLKKWKREWKENLIRRNNPYKVDLYDSL